MCPGGLLTLTCSANASFLQWSVTVPHHQITRTRFLSYIGTAQRATPIIINATMFNITRTFDRTLTFPLISMILADSVTAKLNGTMINCSEIHVHALQNITMNILISKRIHVIANGDNHGMVTFLLIFFYICT